MPGCSAGQWRNSAASARTAYGPDLIPSLSRRSQVARGPACLPARRCQDDAPRRDHISRAVEFGQTGGRIWRLTFYWKQGEASPAQAASPFHAASNDHAVIKENEIRRRRNPTAPLGGSLSRRFSTLHALTIGAVAVVSVACARAPELSEDEFRVLFDGFELIWIGDATDQSLIDDGKVRPEQRPRAGITRVLPGHAYGFRDLQSEINNERLSLRLVADPTEGSTGKEVLVFVYH